MNKISLSEFGYNILQIETVAGCNMSCSFCPYPLKEDKLSTLDIDNLPNINNNNKYTIRNRYYSNSSINEVFFR